MSFKEQQYAFPTQSVEEYLAENLSNDHKKILDFLLQNYGTGAEKIYKSAMYVFLTGNIPAKQMLVIHSFNELINLITRKNVNDFRKKFEKIISEFDFWESEYVKENLQGMVSDISDKAFKPIEERINDIYKLSYTINKHQPLLTKDERKNIAEKIHKIKEMAPKYRHAGDDLVEDNLFFQNAVDEFNEFLGILAKDTSYIEKFNYMTTLIKSKQKKLSKKDIENICSYIDGNLKNVFFSKLENPEWFEQLNEKDLLFYSEFIDENGEKNVSWSAIPYLIKIADKKTNEVFNLIQPILNDMKKNEDINFWIVQNVISLAMKMPDEQFINILNEFYIWIKEKKSIDWIREDDIFLLLDRASKIDKKLTIDIIKQFLSLSIEFSEHTISLWNGENYTSVDTKIISKMRNNFIHAGYIYEQILKILEKVTTIYNIDLFKIFSEIYIEIFNNLTKEQVEQCEYAYELSRSCIENHTQDYIKRDNAIYILVSAIRDSSIKVLQDGNKQEIEQVFIILDKENYYMFTRIILHLLRIGNNYKRAFLKKYILNYDLFSNSKYRYEYFHLIQDKFNELSKKEKDCIFSYIKAGPKTPYYQKDDEYITSKLKKELWKWRKLQPIKDFLTEEQKLEFKDILYNENFKEEHSDFNSYVYIDEDYSFGKDKIKRISVDEFINRLTKYSYSNDDSAILEDEDLEFDLQNDVKQNLGKYINILDKFKVIKPDYTTRLLLGLKENNDKTKEDWKKIIKFGKWLTKQKGKKWNESKKWFASLLSNFFQGRENNKDISIDFLKSSFEIFKTLSLEKEDYLNKKQSNDRNHYSFAINSMHGVAFEGLINYVLWMNYNKKKVEIVDIFNELLTKRDYLETRAVFGRFITWINNIEPDWTKENIDKIFPINDREKFDAAWVTHIIYGRPSSNLFPLLKDKFEYVLENNIYKEYKDEREHIGNDISHYYAWGKIKLEDKIIEKLFSSIDLLLELKYLIKVSGLLLRKGEDEKMVDGFVKLWEKFLENIKSNENDYKDVLKEFEFWYRNEIFDRKWLVQQLHKLVVDFKIEINCYQIKRFLIQDLPLYTREVFNIVREISFTKNNQYLLDKEFVEPVVKYIKENNFEDEILKSDKNKFINDFLRSRTYDIEVWTDKLKAYIE